MAEKCSWDERGAERAQMSGHYPTRDGLAHRTNLA